MGILQQALGNATDFLSNLFGSASQTTGEESTTGGGGMVPDRAIFEANNPPPPPPSPSPTPVNPVQPQPPQIPGMTPQPTGGNLADFGGKIRLADGTISGEQQQTRKDQFNQLKLAMSQAGNTGISNDDFYPGAKDSVDMGNVGSGGYSAPVYAGGGAVLFPIAGYDKMRQRREQERMMSNVIEDQNRAKMVFDLPQIDQKTVSQKIMPQYNQELFGLMAGLKEKYGADIYKKGATDPDVLAFTSKWKALPQAVNDLTNQVKEYYSTVQKDKESGRNTIYDSPIVRALGAEILGGLDGFWKGGNVSVSDLYEAGQKFKAYKNLDTDIKDTLKTIDLSKTIPLLDADVQKQLSVNPAMNKQYMDEVGLPNSPDDYRMWVINQSIKKISDEQADAYANSFMKSYRGSAEAQLALPGDDPAQVPELVRQRVKDMYQGMAGSQMEPLFKEWQAKGSTNNYVTIGGDKPGETYYQTLFDKSNDIIGGTKSIIETINKQNATGTQRADLAKGSFRDMFRKISNKGEVTQNYMGYEPIDVKNYNITSTPLMFNEYKKYDPATRKFVAMTESDYPGIGVGDYENSRPEGNPLLKKLEVVLMQPDGTTIPWDNKNVPQGSELYVVSQYTLDAKKPTTGLTDRKSPKTVTTYSIAPLSQMGKQLDDILQKATKNEKESGNQGGAFSFGTN